jgi:hypothetical protein
MPSTRPTHTPRRSGGARKAGAALERGPGGGRGRSPTTTDAPEVRAVPGVLRCAQAHGRVAALGSRSRRQRRLRRSGAGPAEPPAPGGPALVAVPAAVRTAPARLARHARRGLTVPDPTGADGERFVATAGPRTGHLRLASTPALRGVTFFTWSEWVVQTLIARPSCRCGCPLRARGLPRWRLGACSQFTLRGGRRRPAPALRSGGFEIAWRTRPGSGLGGVASGLAEASSARRSPSGRNTRPAPDRSCRRSSGMAARRREPTTIGPDRSTHDGRGYRRCPRSFRPGRHRTRR